MLSHDASIPVAPTSLGMSPLAQGQDAVLKRLDAWQMRPIWP
jgi:hypothetical protein